MIEIHRHERVGDLVTRHPSLSKSFAQAGIDFCCGGGRTLDEACREAGCEPEELLADLRRTLSRDEAQEPDLRAMSLTQLVEHILEQHHAYLRTEHPHLDMLTEKVALVHGSKDDRLEAVRLEFIGLFEELFDHMAKEEQVLFPMICQLEASDRAPDFHCGSLANPIGQMEREHEAVGSALRRLRALTDGYQAPDWACNTYRAMVDGLARLEHDIHVHVHKENNVLHPAALELEARRQS